MTDPTPTRDEAVLTGIQISGRTLYKLDERGVNIWSANFQPNSGYSEIEADKAAQAVAKIVFRALASAPAPASGRVDVVAVKRKDRTLGMLATKAADESETTTTRMICQEAANVIRALSPAATPEAEAEAEAEPVAWRWRAKDRPTDDWSTTTKEPAPADFLSCEIEPLYAVARSAQ